MQSIAIGRPNTEPKQWLTGYESGDFFCTQMQPGRYLDWYHKTGEIAQTGRSVYNVMWIKVYLHNNGNEPIIGKGNWKFPNHDTGLFDITLFRLNGEPIRRSWPPVTLLDPHRIEPGHGWDSFYGHPLDITDLSGEHLLEIRTNPFGMYGFPMISFEAALRINPPLSAGIEGSFAWNAS